MSTVNKELGGGGPYIGKDRRVRPQVSLSRGIYRRSLRYLSTHRVRWT
jgi:hypothetical protein